MSTATAVHTAGTIGSIQGTGRTAAQGTGTETAAKEQEVRLSERDRIRREQCLNDTMWKVILKIGTPLALYQLLTQVFSVIDTMIASQISAESVSAVSFLTQINQILSAVGGGLAVGAGIQISIAYGKGDYRMVKRRVSTLYAMALGIGLIMLAAILPFTGPFLRFAGTPESLIRIGSSYFSVQLFSMVIVFMNNVYIAVERARGNSGRIMALNMIVIAVKTSLTVLFVYVLKGDLVMIAAATLISQTVLLCFAVRYSMAGKDAFSFSTHAITKDKETCSPMISKSIPVVTERALFAFGKSIVNSMSTIYGDLMVGALGVSNNLSGVATIPLNGYQEGAASVIGQNFGAGKYHRVLEAFYAALVINVLLGAMISGVELLNLNLIAASFAKENAEFHRLILVTAKADLLCAVPLGVNASVLGLLYGLGKNRLTLVLNFMRVFIFRIPLFWAMQHLTSLGERSVGLMMLVSNSSAGLMAAIAAFFVIREYRKKYL